MNTPRLVLIDMDNVIADLDGHLLRVWGERYPNEPTVKPEDRKSHWIGDNFTKEQDTRIRAMVREPQFFADLPAIPGSIEAIKEMIAMGYEVRVCTSPLSHHKTCINEKCGWIREMFDEEFVNRLIVTRDKDLIFGDVLIDDAPEVKAKLRTPVWKHIIFDAPYNQEVTDRPRMHWGNWREVFNQLYT